MTRQDNEKAQWNNYMILNLYIFFAQLGTLK